MYMFNHVNMFDFVYFTFPFALLNTPRHYVLPSLRCLLLSFSILDPLEVNSLSHLWVIVCFSGPSSFLYVITRFTFPYSHTNLFLLNLFRGRSKSYGIIVIPLIIPLWIYMLEESYSGFMISLFLPKFRWHNGSDPLPHE